MARRIVTLHPDDIAITYGPSRLVAPRVRALRMAAGDDDVTVTLTCTDHVWAITDVDNGDGPAMAPDVVEAVRAAALHAIAQEGDEAVALLQQMADDEAADYAEHAAAASARVAARRLAR